MTTNGISSPPATACKVILANNIAKTLLAEVNDGISKLGKTPHLLGILGNTDPAAKLYADWTGKTCEQK